MTREVDLTLLTGFGNEAPFLDALLSHYESRTADARKFSAQARVLLLKSTGGIGIDISLSVLPFEHLLVERATDFEFAPGLSLIRIPPHRHS